MNFFLKKRFYRELQLDLGDGASTSRLSSVEWSIVRSGANSNIGPASNPVRMSTFRSDDEWTEQPERPLGAAAVTAANANSPRSQRRSRSGRAADVRVFI